MDKASWTEDLKRGTQRRTDRNDLAQKLAKHMRPLKECSAQRKADAGFDPYIEAVRNMDGSVAVGPAI